MNITCPHCQAKLNLPDDKIPKDRDSAFKCPKCKESVQIKAGRSGPPARSPAGVPGKLGSHNAEVLVCIADADSRNLIIGAAEMSGWAAEVAPSPAEALKRLEYEIYPLVITDEAFDAKGEMAAHLNELDMSLRRRTCVVRLSRTAKTGDAMTALHSSSNFVVNTQDLILGTEDFAYVILASARTEHEDLYRVYNDSMRAVGKA